MNNLSIKLVHFDTPFDEETIQIGHIDIKSIKPFKSLEKPKIKWQTER